MFFFQNSDFAWIEPKNTHSIFKCTKNDVNQIFECIFFKNGPLQNVVQYGSHFAFIL